MRLQRLDSRYSGRPGVGELWRWCLALAAVAYWAEVILASDEPDPYTLAGITNSIFDAGAFTVAAWAMVLARGGRLVPDRPASLRLVLAALAVGLLCAIPARPAIALALVLLGVALLRWPDASRDGRQAGLLLLLLGIALSFQFISPLLNVVARLDGHAVVWITHAAGLDTVQQGNVVTNGDFGLEILAPCTSAAPLADVVLAFVVVVLYLRGAWRRTDFPWLMAALAGSIVLTEIRLSLMARNYVDYLYWHFGTGSTIYVLTELAVATACAVLATTRTGGAPAEQPA